MRKLIFANNEYYHIFNRGVDKRKIFLRNGHYARFLQAAKQLIISGTARSELTTRQKFAFNKRLDIVCYCLMPNHYHFLIKQKQDNAISAFMHGLNTSYTKYFNLNSDRTGRLFEYTFKAVHVETEEQLLHLSRYIHLNPLLANLITDLRYYSWSSYPEFVGLRLPIFCKIDQVLGLFSKENVHKDYADFVRDQIGYVQELKKIEKMLLE